MKESISTSFRSRLLTWILIIPILLSACGRQAQAAQPTSSPVHYTSTTGQPSPLPVQLREIPVDHVSVEFGVGSPMPVNVFVSGTWPDLCAQLAEMHQEFKGSAVEISLLATPKDEACPPDNLGLPFGFSIPINAAEMPEGEYTVTVNGVSAAFGWGTATAQPVDVTSTPASPSFAAAVYRDDSFGFEFDYPASWTVDKDSQAGDRGTVSQLTSWPHAPGDISAETPDGGSRMDVTVDTWDPKNDLDAFVAARQQAWLASGINVQSQESWGVGSEQRVILFQVLGADQKEAAIFLFTTLGDRYLSLSGSGDIKLLDEIFRTIRFD